MIERINVTFLCFLFKNYDNSVLFKETNTKKINILIK